MGSVTEDKLDNRDEVSGTLFSAGKTRLTACVGSRPNPAALRLAIASSRYHAFTLLMETLDRISRVSLPVTHYGSVRPTSFLSNGLIFYTSE